jgi:hypothetical protein
LTGAFELFPIFLSNLYHLSMSTLIGTWCFRLFWRKDGSIKSRKYKNLCLYGVVTEIEDVSSSTCRPE